MDQAGLFPTFHDRWPPIVTPQYPQNPVIASSRDPNTEESRMTVAFGGLAAGSFRASHGRMVPMRRPATAGRELRSLMAARVMVDSGGAARLGLRGLAGPCDDHTAQNWADALGQGLQVFGQVAGSIGTSQHDAGWTQAGQISQTVATGEHTITSGLCNQPSPTQTFQGSENDMMNQIQAAKNTSTPAAPATYAPAPSSTPAWMPWAIGGGVLAAGAIVAALLLRR